MIQRVHSQIPDTENFTIRNLESGVCMQFKAIVILQRVTVRLQLSSGHEMSRASTWWSTSARSGLWWTSCYYTGVIVKKRTKHGFKMYRRLHRCVKSFKKCKIDIKIAYISGRSQLSITATNKFAYLECIFQTNQAPSVEVKCYFKLHIFKQELLK